MSEVTYRTLKKEDYNTVKTLINQAFNIEKYTGKRLLNLALTVYLRDVLAVSQYTKVAAIKGEVVGVILADLKQDKNPKGSIKHTIISMLASLMILITGFHRLKSTLQYFKFVRTYKRLKKGVKAPLDAEISLFVVNNDLQGYGVGKTLFNDTINYFKMRHVTKYYLFTDDHCNYGFYEYFGLKRAGEEPLSITLNKERTRFNVYMYTGLIEGIK